VFFDWDGTNDLSRIDHVGVVEKVDGDKVYTIEGNTDNVCARRVRSAGTIAGYGRPKYVEAKPDPVPVPEPKAGEYVVKPGDTLSAIAKDHQTTWHEIVLLNQLKDPNVIEVGQVLKMPESKPAPKPGPPSVHLSRIRYGYSSGDTKKMQARLIAKDISIPSGATGYYGNQTKAAVKAAQKEQGFTGSDADGIVGRKTLEWLGLKVI
jgi:LysM repeat protein